MRRALIGLIASMLFLGSAPEAFAMSAGELSRGGALETIPVQQRQTPPCEQPAGSGRWANANPRIDIQEDGVGPAGSWGQPRLCVVYFPKEDVYNLMITGTDNVEQFRAAKAESVRRLTARGFDLCRASKWGSWGTQSQPGYTFDDYYSMTVPCGAQVRAGDAGAEAHLGTVAAALARAADGFAEDLGNRPDAPFSVVVFTEQGAAVDAYRRYRATFETDQAVEAAAVNGASRSVSGQGTNYIYGTVFLINLSDPNYLTSAKIEQDIVNRYSFFALSATAGTDPNVNTGNNATTPRWFQSGLHTRQSYRWAVNGANGGYLVEAARAAREGKIPPLANVQTFDQEREAFAAYDYYTVTARTYAVVTYLYETYGVDGVSGLLRENKNGSVGRFNELLRNLTGQDAAGLDGAVTGWLLGLPSYRAASPGGEIKVEALVYGGGRHGELLVDETAAACLFDVSDQNNQVQGAPGLVGLSIGIGPDGAFGVTRPSARAGNAVAASGKIEAGGGVSGSYRVTNEVTNCDSGAVMFSPS